MLKSSSEDRIRSCAPPSKRGTIAAMTEGKADLISKRGDEIASSRLPFCQATPQSHPQESRCSKLPKSARVKGIVSAAALGVLTGVFSLGAAVPASASGTAVTARPTGCHHETPGDWGAVARCGNHNGGSYRAIAVCKYPNGTVHVIEGPWKKTGWSYAYCQGDSSATSSGIETRV
jgi:hypothetical protein